MKKILFFILVVLSMSACADDMYGPYTQEQVDVYIEAIRIIESVNDR